MTTWYCPLPFRHAYIDSTGVGACCQTARYPINMDQWIEHPELKKLQLELLQGQQPRQCRTCVHSERQYGRSLRTDSIRDYQNEIFTDTTIDFVDFRSINICNFKCRSCNPVFSHGISQEAHRHHALQQFFGQPPDGKTAAVTSENVDWIMNNLSSLKRIMFTGGEPTVIPEVKTVIEKIRRDHKDIMIMITSNASFQDSFWKDLTQEMPNLHWTVSIDAVGSRAEIVRHGTDWNLVEHNVAWLAEHASSLDINSVVTNLNVLGLKPLLEFGRRMQYLSRQPQGRHGDLGCRHQFFVCFRPYYLAADNWPDQLKSRVLDYLDKCLLLDLDGEQTDMLTGLISKIKQSDFDASLWHRTQSYNDLLDSIRNENHSTLYEATL